MPPLLMKIARHAAAAGRKTTKRRRQPSGHRHTALHHSVQKSVKSVASSHVMLVECIAVEKSPGEVSGRREETKPPTSKRMLPCFS